MSVAAGTKGVSVGGGDVGVGVDVGERVLVLVGVKVDVGGGVWEGVQVRKLVGDCEGVNVGVMGVFV